MRLFIANVGARDLQVKVNGRLCSLQEQGLKDFLLGFFGYQQIPDQPSVRALGEWLLKQKKSQQEKFQQFLKEVVACPILEPALDLALGEAQTLDVYLLGTDQPDDAPANLRANDTYWAAEIIKQWLCQYYKNREKLGQVCVLKISDIVPARWDEAYQLIASLKVAVDGNQEVELRELLQQSQEVFAEISGGIPALNFALHQVVLNVCGRKARIIQVLEKPGQPEKGEPCLLDIQVFWGDRLIRQLETLLKSYDYKAAIDLLENEIPEDQRTEQIQKAIAALRHADARLNFDFQKALTAIEYYKNVDPFQDWYNSANHQTFADRVREALGCLEIFCRSHRLIAFIALADGIVEGLARLAAETLVPKLRKIYRRDNKPIPNPFVPRRYVNLGGLPKLRNHLQQYLQSQGKRADGWVLADEQFYDGIIDYFKHTGSNQQKSAVNKVSSDLGKLRTCLGGFRNGLLHSLANLSEDDLSEVIVQNKISDSRKSALSDLVKAMKNLWEYILTNLSQLTFTAAAPLMEKAREKWEASQQSSKQVASSPKSKRLVFDDINDFVLKTLSKAWGVPLPPQ
jgi:tetratricopeptide (TPR) repeat protein